MGQRGYVVLFILVLLLACAGGFLGGRLVIGRLQQDFRPRTSWAPATPVAGGGVQSSTPAPSSGAPSASSTVAMPTAATTAGVPSPRPLTTPEATRSDGPLAGIATPEATSPASITVEPTPTATETPIASPSPLPVFPFDLAQPVRHSSDDCPGTYILGQVTDRAGDPLPGVRLWLVDEYNNQETAVTKSGGDAGRYDFPIFGPPRKFYLTVVDGSGQPISPRIEISHASGAQSGATCHWVDWLGR
jgi:hypothetical protein